MKDNINIRKELKTIRYNRVSSLSQKLDRQQKNNSDYNYVFEDTCSGTITENHVERSPLSTLFRSTNVQ